ncbi:hypothetical protein NDA16_003362 [Ustilago loliicola]|nr:hypothetical protein NDA16_003362 [Ustilago loliicola]
MNEHIFNWRNLRRKVLYDNMVTKKLTDKEVKILEHEFSHWGSKALKNHADSSAYLNPHTLTSISLDYQRDAAKIKQMEQTIANYLDRLKP